MVAKVKNAFIRLIRDLMVIRQKQVDKLIADRGWKGYQ